MMIIKQWLLQVQDGLEWVTARYQMIISNNDCVML
jgi:hypothetical protein